MLKLLNEIVEEFECEVFEGEAFNYWYAENLIEIAYDDECKEFYQFAIDNGLNPVVSEFCISFFHELGHNETIDDCDEYEGDINALSYEEYFNLESEYSATMWAIDFCNSHLELCKKIDEKLANRG